MELSERKKKILQAIIDDYIVTAEPVGSSYILGSHNLGISSATVRNEMAALEKLGYLEKPHTSAGRVPSDLGYRVYVNELMNEYKLTLNEINQIKLALEKKFMEFNKIITNISDVASVLTNYTTVFTMPTAQTYTISNIKLMSIDNHSFVMIIVTGNGVVKSTQISVEKPYDVSVLEKLSNWLNNRFSGMSASLVDKSVLSAEKDIIPVEENLLEPIFAYLYEVVSELSDVDIHLSGTTNIFNHPEFNNIDRAKDFLTFVKKDNISDLKQLMSTNSDSVSVIIGDENPVLKDHDLSMVVSNYNLGEGFTGKLAVIGPTRMDYAKAVSTLNYLINILNKRRRMIDDGS